MLQRLPELWPPAAASVGDTGEGQTPGEKNETQKHFFKPVVPLTVQETQVQMTETKRWVKWEGNMSVFFVQCMLTCGESEDLP